MRVTGGELRGRRVPVPRGSRLRPTSDRVREALFSMLGEVSGERLLDLYCGTGVLAAEALSRGAASAVLVDTDPDPARRTLQALGLGDRATVVGADVGRWLAKAEAEAGGFDLVLVDPPYRIAARVARDLQTSLPRHLRPEARVVLEGPPGAPVELDWPLVRDRTYGSTALRIHRWGPGE